MRSVDLLIILLAIAVLSACRYDKDGACPADLICTLEFRAVSVQVTDSAGAAVALDSTHTIDIAKGTVVLRTPGPDPFPGGGYYTVLSDHHISNTDTGGRDFRFDGYRDGSITAQAEFRIRHDCCHIHKVSGPEVIVME